MDSLLRLQESHISKHILRREHLHRLLKVRHNYVRHYPDERIMNYLEAADFGLITQVGYFNIDNYLITAMVERWRPETHTFHLPYGECTVTLEDVELQLGLPINGRAVVGPTYNAVYYSQLCLRLLGAEPPIEETLGHSFVSLSWLAKTFAKLPNNATDMMVQQYSRAYMLRLIGGIMMPDKSGIRVNMMYLPLLEDLSKVCEYSWGSATLAFLYRELCKATMPKNKKGEYTCQIGGCMMLLQAWIWDHIPHLAPRRQPLSNFDAFVHCKGFPLARRWGTKNKDSTDLPNNSLTYYRLCLDHLTLHQFVWNPYPSMMELRGTHTNSTTYWAVVPIICFFIVEWHQVDRVMRQFGMVQNIPDSPENLDGLHKINLRNRHNISWQDVFATYIQAWDERNSRTCLGMPYVGAVILTIDNSVYMRWYAENSIRWLCPRIGDSIMEDFARQILGLTKSRDANAFDTIDALCMEMIAQSMEDQTDQPHPIRRKHPMAKEMTSEDVEMANVLLQKQGYTCFEDIPPYYHRGFPNDPAITSSTLIFPYQQGIVPYQQNSCFASSSLTSASHSHTEQGLLLPPETNSLGHQLGHPSSSSNAPLHGNDDEVDDHANEDDDEEEEEDV